MRKIILTTTGRLLFWFTTVWFAAARSVNNDFGIVQPSDAQLNWFEDVKCGKFLY